MAEELIINGQSREEVYQELLPQIYSLVEWETNTIANLANVSAALHQAFGFFWVGFYLTVSENELVLGPFQGPIACTRIRKGKGVCGSVFESAKSIIVDDVDLFPGHIACSSASRSEIVIPLIKEGRVVGVLDVDSDQLADFDDVDDRYLTELCAHISKVLNF